MSDTLAELSVSLWRGGEDGRYQTYTRAAARQPDRARRRHLRAAPYRSDPVVSLRLPGRHVRLLRHDRQRPAALDLPHARREGRRATAGSRSARCENLPVIKDLAADMAAVLREVAGGQGRVRAVADAARPDARGSGRTARRASPPMRRSNASIAASAMPPAIPCAGTRTISGRRRSTAPGRWSTTSATPATASGCRPSRRPAAATPATRTSRARNIARNGSIRPRRSPA